MMARVTMYPDTAEITSHLPGVAGATYDEAQERGRHAEARLASHRYPTDDPHGGGTAKIEVERRYPDALVSLVDPGALSIEFGHRARNGKPVQGLYIITGVS